MAEPFDACELLPAFGRRRGDAAGTDREIQDERGRTPSKHISRDAYARSASFFDPSRKYRFENARRRSRASEGGLHSVSEGDEEPLAVFASSRLCVNKTVFTLRRRVAKRASRIAISTPNGRIMVRT